MRVEKFMKDIRNILPCIPVYYPREQQVVIFNVNHENIKLCYDEEFIEQNWADTVFCVVEDDLFRIGIDIDITGRV